MHLKYSNGSKQSPHLYAALHGVEPNSLISVVLVALHRGHAIALSAPKIERLLADSAGGAMP
jgi:hypothetical protein